MTPQPSLCLHAHFYQPSREDPFTGLILDEPGAEPFRNWNERVLADCYGPNASLGNFREISFNLGPTLSGWMQANANSTLRRIVNEDRENMALFGVGNAMAQPFHHTILPLSSRRDKETQVKWGIYAFSRCFGRLPQGMWLPETAVDYETLEVLAENGIEFTILAPWQVDRPDAESSSPLRVELKNGKSIAVFVFHQNLSTSLSFNPESTVNADGFLTQFVLPEYQRSNPNVLLIATDGELYGHHQPFRDKFLNYLMKNAAPHAGLHTTFPALWLKENPPTQSTRLIENTSWSCLHGIERWRDECGCSSNAEWKRPLRQALDVLSTIVDHEYESAATDIGVDPWTLRDDYAGVFLGDAQFDEWIKEKKPGRPEGAGVDKLRRLLLAEYECQRMFTSCGWFFDDLTRIEPHNCIISASHAAWLVENSIGKDIVHQFLPLLEKSRDGRNQASAGELFRSSYQRFTATVDRI